MCFIATVIAPLLAFGASARVELIGPDGQPLEAELTRDEAESLRLQGGQRVDHRRAEPVPQARVAPAPPPCR